MKVTDTGIGIPAADLPHVTEPFYRGDHARSVHEGGAGLGLTIARAAMEEHRGSLDIESSPGKGTTITLQLRPPDPCPAAVLSRGGRKSSYPALFSFSSSCSPNVSA